MYERQQFEALKGTSRTAIVWNAYFRHRCKDQWWVMLVMIVFWGVFKRIGLGIDTWRSIYRSFYWFCKGPKGTGIAEFVYFIQQRFFGSFFHRVIDRVGPWTMRQGWLHQGRSMKWGSMRVHEGFRDVRDSLDLSWVLCGLRIASTCKWGGFSKRRVKRMMRRWRELDV